jgi:hypothetical protein
MYCVQNEMAPDLRNPRVHWLLRRMHEEDPSRPVVLKSGIPPRNQAWMAPYEETIHVDRGDGVSGWRDQHTVGGPGVWQDQMYKSPAEFTHNSKNREEVVMWGEMLGSATPDNHSGMIRQIEADGGTSYDLAEHRALLKSYDTFLDLGLIRLQDHESSSLLATSATTSGAGSSSRPLSVTTISSSAAGIVAIENHSGLLDLRNFKNPPC